MALRQHVHVLLRGQPLDLHALAHLGPGLGEEVLLELAESALGRAHQVARADAAHLGQAVLGGDAAVHHPDALGFAVALLDAVEEVAQRGGVGRVARQHLVAQREALGRDDQRDDHLPAIAALVAAVAELAQVIRPALDVGLEVGAGQVVQQHLEARTEQLAPAALQELEQLVLVLHQLVQAAVQGVLLGQREVRVQQVGHGAGIEPLPVQSPLRARVDEPVGHQRLEHLQPRRAFARGAQPRPPEAVEFELLPQIQRQPACAPLARAAQAQFAQAHADRIDVVGGHRAGREQRDLAPLPALVHFDGLAPGFALAGVDLAQVQHLALHDAPVGKPAVLHEVPVFVGLAILHASGAAQEHAPHSTKHTPKAQGPRSSLQAFRRAGPLRIKHLRQPKGRNRTKATAS